MENKNNNGGLRQSLFLPAISLLNRMSYTRKFSLLWVLSLVAIAVVVYSLFVSLDRVIQPSERQLKGLVLIEPVSRTIQTLQLHRGISLALHDRNNRAMHDLRAAKESEAAEAFEAMERKLPASLASCEPFLRIKADWQQLRQDGPSWKMETNFAAHTRLIEQLHLFQIFAADEYLLTLDPEIATFYLIDTAINKLPHALEHLGQLRAYGTGILTRKYAAEQQKVKLHNLIAELDSALYEFKVGLYKTGRHNPALQKRLNTVSEEIAASVWHITSLVESDILSGRYSTPPDEFLNTATAEIDKSYAQLYGSILPTAEALINTRISNAKSTLYTSTGLAFLAFLVVLYFSVSMYYAIIGNIQSLARSARSFASGNLQERVKLDTHDELSHVGASFNEMADGFKAMLEARQEDESRLSATFETAMDAVVQMDSKGVVIGWNSQAENIFGWLRNEALGRMLHETIIPAQYREAHMQGLNRFLLTGEGPILNTRVEMIGLHRDGHEFPAELTVAPIKLAGKYEFSAFIRDITRKKESEDLIWRQANFDLLTGLPNRRMFYDRLAQEIKKSHRGGQKMALLFVDLDKFKEVNDTLGHGMGDTLLVEAARRIGDCVRETDTVARLGGDEFIVILPELEDTGSIERIAENILQQLAEPFQLEDNVAYMTASIGITLYPVDSTEVDELLKNADQAMYAAKNSGRNRFSYFMHSMQQAAQARLRMVNELRGALAASQFRIYYQPVIDMATGRINKAEALIRWQHPERGMVNPVRFIPLAEETGLITEIGDWVFRESARQLKHWRLQYNTGLEISVNVSPVQFNSADCICKTWLDYLQALGLPPQYLTIEITEGLLLKAESGVTDKLIGFREAGIKVAIDDFGTGYSALSYLKKFDIDLLKIDSTFVRDLATDQNDMALTEAIIVMAHKLGLKVIAEGVETEEQRKLLAEAGCDYAQGFLFSRPVPTDEFEELLKNDRYKA